MWNKLTRNKGLDAESLQFMTWIINNGYSCEKNASGTGYVIPLNTVSWCVLHLP